MANITVKGIPDDLYKQLKERAKQNRRSINQEIITCIEHQLTGHPIDPEALLRRARRTREKTKQSPLTNERLRKMKNEGRP